MTSKTQDIFKPIIKFQKLSFLILFFLLLLTTSFAGETQESEKRPEALKALLTEAHLLQTEIYTLTMDTRCREDSDCDSIPFGAKPCGGPRKFIVTTKSITSSKRLKELLAKHTELDDKINKAQKMMSTCDLTVEPKLRCLKQKCTAQ